MPSFSLKLLEQLYVVKSGKEFSKVVKKYYVALIICLFNGLTFFVSLKGQICFYISQSETVNAFEL